MAIKTLLGCIIVFLSIGVTNQSAAQSVTVDQNLAFGVMLVGGGNKTIAPTSASAAKFTIEGTNDASIAVSFTAPATLDRTAGGNPTPLTFTADVVGNATDNPGAGVALTAGTQTKVLSATGAYYVFVGGTLTDNESLAAGNYTAVFTLTIVYN